MVTSEQYLGLDDSKLVNFKDCPNRMQVLNADRDALKALVMLVEDAATQGFELRVASAYRSFYKQFKIFDDKLLGSQQSLDFPAIILVPTLIFIQSIYCQKVSN